MVPTCAEPSQLARNARSELSWGTLLSQWGTSQSKDKRLSRVHWVKACCFKQARFLNSGSKHQNILSFFFSNFGGSVYKACPLALSSRSYGHATRALISRSCAWNNLKSAVKVKGLSSFCVCFCTPSKALFDFNDWTVVTQILLYVVFLLFRITSGD